MGLLCAVAAVEKLQPCVVETLHPEAHAVHPEGSQLPDFVGMDVVGVGFEGDFSVRVDGKEAVEGFKHLRQFFGIEL